MDGLQLALGEEPPPTLTIPAHRVEALAQMMVGMVSGGRWASWAAVPKKVQDAARAEARTALNALTVAGEA